MKTETSHVLSLEDAFTPTYDLFLQAPYSGNHRDFAHQRIRNGDEVVERTFWGRDTAEHWVNVRETRTSIRGLVQTLEQATGVRIILVDDLPEGISYPTA
jgi:hypothetical protein